MYARVTSLEVDTVRIGVEEALEMFRREMLPSVREQPGYEGILMMATGDGKGLAITLWATENDARRGTDTADGFYSEVIARFMTVFRAPPGREFYEVMLAETPSLTAD